MLWKRLINILQNEVDIMKSVDKWEEVRKLAKLIGLYTGKKQYEVMHEALLHYINSDDNLKKYINMIQNEKTQNTV